MDVYNVIEIIDEYTLIINYGFENRAKKGDFLRIYSIGEVVKDATGKELGTIDNIKETVQVVTPYPRFSICKKISNTELEILNPLSNLLINRMTAKKLNVNEQQITNRVISEIEPINVGDCATVLPK